MSIIDQFISRYIKEYDYYQELARRVANKCESLLDKNGIRAIVTHRAKRPDRLETKLLKQDAKYHFSDVNEIYNKIVDLAGVRIALYFPADSDNVCRIIESEFDMARGTYNKKFPENNEIHDQTNYKKKFSGYHAIHYRVKIKSEDLSEIDSRFGQSIVEIQVASVLMHAWSEVEHDLVYKPLSGQLSDNELAILDEINGLVIAGEIALERLQIAIAERVDNEDNVFNNHYELASLIYNLALSKFIDYEPAMGRADILLKFLHKIKFDSSKKIKEFISNIDVQSEAGPLVDQIVDLILLMYPEYYYQYTSVKAEMNFQNPYASLEELRSSSSNNEALGYFITRWASLERILKFIQNKKDPQNNFYQRLNLKVLNELSWLKENKDIISDINYLRNLRNQVIHGIEYPASDTLINAGKNIEEIINYIQTKLPSNYKSYKTIISREKENLTHQELFESGDIMTG